MTVTLADLLTSTRDRLAAHPIIAELLDAMDAKTSTLRMESSILSGFMGNRALLEIDSEVMLVVNKPEDTTSIEVVRRYQGTTAAAHAKGSEVKIHEIWGWTDVALKRDINKAILWLRPHSWTQATGTAFTWSANYFEATPATADGISYPHGNYIIRLERLDTSRGVNNYLPFNSWLPSGNKLRFREATTSDLTLRPIIAKMQPTLSALTTALDDDIFAEAIELYAAHLAFNALKTNRVRYTEYSAALNDRASTPDELIRTAFDLKNQAVVARETFMRPLPAGYVSTYREP